jgi:Short C-terminal domain
MRVVLNPFTHRKVLKNGMPGRATIVTRGALDRGATSFNLPMTLQVHVEGVTPYEVEDQWMVKAKDTVALDGSIPVRVDRNDHGRVAIDWDGLRREHEEHVQARREALARGRSFGPTVTIAEPQVINLGGDAEATEEIQRTLAQLGFGADVQQQVQGAFEHHAAPDDTISKLERLAALRAGGVLSEAEFEAQKRRVLGES